uniref:Uncharacterized protein n=1 Tax=Plectus sambesii TaxID=2011161 RepID=A0A914VJT7_9BILA
RLKTNYAELFELVRRSLGPEPLTDTTPAGVRRRLPRRLPSVCLPPWTEADEAAYQATSRSLDDAARPDTPPPPGLTRQALREQLWPLYNIAVSEECRQHLLSIRRGDVHSLRAEDFDLAAPIGELNCGPFLADTELTEALASILLNWLKEEVEETNDGMMRHHQYNYSTGVWLPEAVAFALQQQNPDIP